MKKRRIPIYLLAAVNAAVVLALWFTGFSDCLNPRLFGWLSLGGYAFPALLLCTIAFIVMWVFIKKRYIGISVVGLLVAYHPVSLYCPVNGTQEVPEDAFEVITYNTHYWGRGEGGANKDDGEEGNLVINYLVDSGADVVCLQEAFFYGNIGGQIDGKLLKTYEHYDTLRGNGGSTSTVFSRYPVIRKELIPIETKGNVVGAFWLNVKGREVIVINCHLQTTGLSIADRENFSNMVHGYQETDTMRHTSRTVFGKLLDAAKLRAGQAEMVASFIRMHKGTPMIVCGDFNDIPQSYVHHTIAAKLTDCYQETAFGPGYSFSQYGMRVRIDNMLCTPDLKPYNCHTDKTISVSDHYPVRCHFSL